MRRILLWLRNGLLALMGLVLLALAGLYGLSEYRLRQRFVVEATELAIPRDDAAIAEGRRLSIARGCADCHAADMGGRTVIHDPLLGTISGSNLTSGSGGIVPFYNPASWARAVRHGVAADGRSLLLMPSHEFAGMSDADLGAIIAYIQQLPSVDRQPMANSIGPLGRMLYLTGQLTLLPAEIIDHQASYQAAAVGISVEYGRYLSAGCTGCHGERFSGGPIPGGPPAWPAAQNITPDQATGIGSWSEDDFIHAIREGVRPDGSAISEVMPWKNFRMMTDTELKALYLFLQQVPALPEGGR